MSRRGGLNLYVPKLKRHMLEQKCALTPDTAAELLEVNRATAYNVLYYMEATGIVQRLTRGIGFYFLKGFYDETQIEAILKQAGAKDPMTQKARPAKWVRPRKRRNRKSLVAEHLESIRSSYDSDDGLGALSIIGLNRPSPVTPQGESKREEPPRTLRAPVERRLPKAVSDLPKEMRRLSSNQARYLRERYLTGFKGIESFKGFNTFFANVKNLEKGEYGSIIYAAMGTNPWDRVNKLMLGPGMTPLAEVENRRWKEWAAFSKGIKTLDKPRYKKEQYDLILNQFLEGGHEVVEVKVEDRTPYYMRTILSKLITERDLGVKAFVKKKILHLKMI